VRGCDEDGQTLTPAIATATPILAGGGVSIASRPGQQAEVQRIDFLRDAHHVANDITVIGQLKRHQVVLAFAPEGAGFDGQTRSLRPAWDSAVHDLANWANADDAVECGDFATSGEFTFQSFAARYNTAGPEHDANRDAFRAFAWNEDGAFADVIPDAPDLWEFGMGPTGQFTRRPRPLGHTLTFDAATRQTRRLPRRVEIGVAQFSGGQVAIVEDSWMPLGDDTAKIWDDRAGVSIIAPNLADGGDQRGWRPYSAHPSLQGQYGDYSYLTLLHNTLRFDPDNPHSEPMLCLRLIGSIESDQALTGRAPRTLGGAWPFRAERVVIRPERFRSRCVSDALDPDAPADLADDADEAEAYARRVRDVAQDCRGHGSIILRGITRAYGIGAAIPSTAGRAVNLTLDGGARAVAPVVVAITWNFEEGVSKTELLLDSPLMRVTQ
jgi:hypothetical protein